MPIILIDLSASFSVQLSTFTHAVCVYGGIFYLQTAFLYLLFHYIFLKVTHVRKCVLLVML